MTIQRRRWLLLVLSFMTVLAACAADGGDEDEAGSAFADEADEDLADAGDTGAELIDDGQDEDDDQDENLSSAECDDPFDTDAATRALSVQTAGGTLHLRATPDGDIVGELAHQSSGIWLVPGSCVVTTGGNDWTQVETPLGQGWVASSFITPIEAYALPTEDQAAALQQIQAPTSESGSDLIEQLPPPQLCDPNLDNGSGGNYTGLAGLPLLADTEVDPSLGQLDANAELAQSLLLTNEFSEQFVVTIAGADDAAISEYVTEASICIESVADAVPNDVALPSASSIEVLTLEVVEDFGLGPAELIDLLDAEETRTFAAALSNASVALEDVFQEVKQRWTTQRGSAPTELEVGFDYLAWMDGAPWIPDPRLHPGSGEVEADDFASVLRDDDLLVTFTPVEETLVNTSLFVAIDPSVDADDRVYYRAKCRREVWLRVRAWDGSMAAKLWQTGPYKLWGSRVANKARTDYPSWIAVSQNDRIRYDANVTGLQNNSRYSLYGYWRIGSGSDC